MSKIQIERDGLKVEGFLSSKNDIKVINWMVHQLGDAEAQAFNLQLKNINQLAILEEPALNEQLILEFLDYCLTFNVQSVLMAVEPQEVQLYQKMGFENIASGKNKVLMTWG